MAHQTAHMPAHFHLLPALRIRLLSFMFLDGFLDLGFNPDFSPCYGKKPFFMA